MRNCFFYYIYFLCKLQYNFHVIHFFVKITNHCLFLFVIFHIKHQSFPLRALSSSGYSQSASLRSSTPNQASPHTLQIILYQFKKTTEEIRYLLMMISDFLCILFYKFSSYFSRNSLTSRTLPSLQILSRS